MLQRSFILSENTGRTLPAPPFKSAIACAGSDFRCKRGAGSGVIRIGAPDKKGSGLRAASFYALSARFYAPKYARISCIRAL